MALPQLAFAVLALACLGIASEHDCDEVVKPLIDFSSASGKWIFHAGTTDSEDTLAKLKTIFSSWIHPKYTTDGTCPEGMEIADKIDGKCVYINANLTTVGDRVVVDFNYENHTHIQDGQHLKTCPDCLVWTGISKMHGSADGKSLFIFTRSGNLSLPHLEVFKQQAACLNFTLGLHMGSAEDLCPEKKEEKDPKEE